MTQLHIHNIYLLCMILMYDIPRMHDTEVCDTFMMQQYCDTHACVVELHMYDMLNCMSGASPAPNAQAI